MSMARADQSPASGIFNVLRWLMPAFVPVSALLYAASWNQLPERMATHFGMDGQPNGWMPRQDSFIFSVVLTVVVAGLGIIPLARVKRPDFLAWTVLAVLYFVLGAVLLGTESVIAYNLSGHALDPTPFLVAGICVLTVVVTVALLSHRGRAIPATPPFAEEMHASHFFALILMVPCAALALGALKVPLTPVRIALGAGSVVMLVTVAMAWTGFHYFFSSAGVEIRLLGFRLRSIPTSEICSYAFDRWSAMGGYGIRGLGNRRAYVWGNRGVRIQTTEGEVFLGHDQPERIVRHLDRITGGVAKQQVLS